MLFVVSGGHCKHIKCESMCDFSRVLILEVQIRFAATLKSKSNDVQHFRNTEAS